MSSFSLFSLAFFPDFLQIWSTLRVVNALSRVGLRNKTDHSVRSHRRLMQVPLLKAQETSYTGSKTSLFVQLVKDIRESKNVSNLYRMLMLYHFELLWNFACSVCAWSFWSIVGFPVYLIILDCCGISRVLDHFGPLWNFPYTVCDHFGLLQDFPCAWSFWTVVGFPVCLTILDCCGISYVLDHFGLLWDFPCAWSFDTVVGCPVCMIILDCCRISRVLDHFGLLKRNWSLPVSCHPHLIGPFVRDAIKVQPGFITSHDVAKPFGSIWFKHFEHALWTFNSLSLSLVC